jgi:hypothetical protein
VCSKTKNNTERCLNKPLKGFTICRKHARMKNPIRWTGVAKDEDKCIMLQKLWRGRSVRSWLALAGPGVLKRSICHNEEELVTMDERKDVHPFDYFSFVENGKIYWFDIRTIAQNSTLSVTPANPYTREPLSIETRQRLRNLCIRRERLKMSNVHNVTTKQSYQEASETTWVAICQILGENGYNNVLTEYFTTLNRTQLYIFISMLEQDMIAWGAEHTNILSRRHRYTSWIKRVLEEYSSGARLDRMSYIVSRVLLTILNDYPNPYPVCFIIIACFQRL